MIMPTDYVPLLRWRMGEYQALERLDPGLKAGVVPLIEVLPPDYDFELRKPKKGIGEQLAPFAKQLKKRWGEARQGRQQSGLSGPLLLSDGVGSVSRTDLLSWQRLHLRLSDRQRKARQSDHLEMGRDQPSHHESGGRSRQAKRVLSVSRTL